MKLSPLASKKSLHSDQKPFTRRNRATVSTSSPSARASTSSEKTPITSPRLPAATSASAHSLRTPNSSAPESHFRESEDLSRRTRKPSPAQGTGEAQLGVCIEFCCLGEAFLWFSCEEESFGEPPAEPVPRRICLDAVLEKPHRFFRVRHALEQARSRASRAAPSPASARSPRARKLTPRAYDPLLRAARRAPPPRLHFPAPPKPPKPPRRSTPPAPPPIPPPRAGAAPARSSASSHPKHFLTNPLKDQIPLLYLRMRPPPAPPQSPPQCQAPGRPHHRNLIRALLRFLVARHRAPGAPTLPASPHRDSPQFFRRWRARARHALRPMSK